MAELTEQIPPPSSQGWKQTFEKVASIAATARNWALCLVAAGMLFKLAWIVWCLADGALDLQAWEWLTLPLISSHQHLLFGAGCFLLYLVLLLPSAFARPMSPLRSFAFLLLSAFQVLGVLYFMTALRMALVLGTPPTFGLLQAGAQGGVLGSSLISPENLPYTIVGAMLAGLTVFASFMTNRRWPTWPASRRTRLFTGIVMLWVALGLSATALARSELHHAHIEPVSFFFFELFQQRAERDRPPVEHNPEAYRTALLFGESEEEVTRHHFKNLDRWRQTQRNVVLIILESVHAKNASYAVGPVDVDGDERDTTPHLSKLRENMLTMDNHYAVHPTSMEDIFSINCSLYPYPLRPVITDVNPAIPCGTMSEMLVDAGYVAALYHSGHFSFWRKDLFFENRGFERMYDADTMPRRQGAFEYNWGVDERVAAHNIAEFIHENRDRPFFVEYIPVFPHSPYTVPEASMEVFEGGDELDRYHNSLRYVDGAINTIIEALREDELLDDTLLIVVADHGEAFEEHAGNRSHSAFIYEENVHVPLGLHNPILFEGAPSIERVTNHLDILPTVADLLDIPRGQAWQGRSLLEDGPSQLIYFYSVTGRQLVGLRDGQFKVIWNRSNRTTQIFDLNVDPAEQNNLVTLYSDRVGRYHQTLTQWRSYQLALIPRFGRQGEGGDQGRLWLADQRPARMYQPHHYDPVADHSVAGRDLNIDWVSFEHGLGVHADSWYTYDLSQLNARRLVGRVGRDRRMNQGYLEAALFLDGELALVTGPLVDETPAISFDFNVENVREVSLVAWTTDDGGRGDHLNWADLHFVTSADAVYQPGNDIALETLRPSGVNRNGIDVTPISVLPHERVRIGGERVTEGLIVPGNAAVHYDIRPLGATRFRGRLMPGGFGDGAPAELVNILIDDESVWDGYPNRSAAPATFDIEIPATARLLTIETSETDEEAAQIVLAEVRLSTSTEARDAMAARFATGGERRWELASVPPALPVPSSELVGWSRDREGDFLEVDGLESSHSFWQRNGARLRYILRGLGARRVTGRVVASGGDDCHITATIRAGDELLWEAGRLSPSDPSRPFSVELEEGVEEIVLEANGDEDDCSLIWGEPALEPS